MALPIIPWIGGKRRLAAQILPLFGEHTCYVEPFCGAAALFFLKEPSKVEVLNDINGDLVSLYRVVQHHLDEFVRQFRWALGSREIFEWCQAVPPKGLTDIQRAARFFYLQKLAFGAKVDGQHFGTSTTGGSKLNLLRIEEDLSEAHLRLHGVTVEHEAWHSCVERYDRPHTLVYMDPPYWGTEGYGVGFGLDQYARMAELMGRLKGRGLVSVNDIPEMRAAFKGLPMKRLATAYSVSKPGPGRAPRHELLIASWKAC